MRHPVTYKKNGSIESKKEGMPKKTYVLHYLKYDSGAPPPKSLEREREGGETERETERAKFVYQEGTAADPVEKVLMTFLFFLFTFFMSLGSKSSSNPQFSGALGGLFLGADLDLLGIYAVPRPLANTGRSSQINS